MFGKKNKSNGLTVVEKVSFGKNESDRTPYIEPKFYYEITYKTQLEVVQNDNQVICSDFNIIILSSTEKHGDPVLEHIDTAYKNGYIRLRGGKEEYYTIIATKDIKKILYRPKFTSEKKREQND